MYVAKDMGPLTYAKLLLFPEHKIVMRTLTVSNSIFSIGVTELASAGPACDG